VRAKAELRCAASRQSAEVYEPLAWRKDATHEQRSLAKLTEISITAFQCGLLLIFSSSANASGHVKREVERAASLNLQILPFRSLPDPMHSGIP